MIIRYTGRAVIDWGSNDKDCLVCLLRDLSPKCPEAARCTNLIVVNYDSFFFFNFTRYFDVLGFNRAQSRFGGNLIDLYHNFISDVWVEIVLLFYFLRFVDRKRWMGYCLKGTCWYKTTSDWTARILLFIFGTLLISILQGCFYFLLFPLIKVCYCSRGVKIVIEFFFCFVVVVMIRSFTTFTRTIIHVNGSLTITSSYACKKKLRNCMFQLIKVTWDFNHEEWVLSKWPLIFHCLRYTLTGSGLPLGDYVADLYTTSSFLLSWTWRGQLQLTAWV